MFVDLRDRTGLVQIVFNTEFSTRAHEIADRLRNEFVVAVSGQVVMRDAETVNPNLPTGDVEVRVTDIEILNGAKTRRSSLKTASKLMSRFACGTVTWTFAVRKCSVR